MKQLYWREKYNSPGSVALVMGWLLEQSKYIKLDLCEIESEPFIIIVNENKCFMSVMTRRYITTFIVWTYFVCCSQGPYMWLPDDSQILVYVGYDPAGYHNVPCLNILCTLFTRPLPVITRRQPNTNNIYVAFDANSFFKECIAKWFVFLSLKMSDVH